MGNKQPQKKQQNEEKTQPIQPIANPLQPGPIDPFAQFQQRHKQITVKPTNFDQVKTTSNVQDAKLQLLVFGYLRENIGQDFDKTADIELINQSAVWLRQSLTLKFKCYYGRRRALPLQIWIEGDELNIFDSTNIKHYVIKYFDGENGVMNDIEAAKENEGNANVVCTSFIYPFNCLSWTSRNDIRYDHQRFTFIKIMAIDKDDRIIVSTEWKKMGNNIMSVTYCFPNPDYYDTLLAFWNENIAKKCDTELVDVNQWTEAMMDPNVQLIDNEELAKKLFYFILFEGGKGDNKDGKELLMDVKDFDVFVSDGTFGEYRIIEYGNFASNCWRKIGIGNLY